MERKVGEIFEFNGVKLMTQRDYSPIACEGCYFDRELGFCHKISCTPGERTDKTNVIFREIKNYTMTREEAKELMPFIQAFAEGKTVEFLNNDGMWEENKSPLFCSEPKRYRIKPEPKYRPFETKEECWEEMQKHQPFGWIIDKNCNYACITRVSGNCSYDDFFKTVTFVDGTPFGIKEE